jgi:hypothetical protein
MGRGVAGVSALSLTSTPTLVGDLVAASTAHRPLTRRLRRKRRPDSTNGSDERGVIPESMNSRGFSGIWVLRDYSGDSLTDLLAIGTSISGIELLRNDTNTGSI